MNTYSSIGALRGTALRLHLQQLSAKYNWGSLVVDGGLDNTPVANSSSAVGDSQRRLSIHQSPARILRPATSSVLPVSTDKINSFFIADTSSEEEEEEESGAGVDVTMCMNDGESFLNGEDINEMPVLEGCDFEDDSQFVMEYVPTPPPIAAKKRTVASNPGKTKTVAPSSTKPPRTPLAIKTSGISATTPSNLISTSKSISQFRKKKEVLTSSYFQQFNTVAFDGLLPGDLNVSWNKRLLTTAGITKMKLTSIRQMNANTTTSSMVRTKAASIELSEKVIDNEERLQTTLLHEMCHAAAWLLDGERKPPHGPAFWKYAKQASAILPELMVTTCHSYNVHKPYKFRCVDDNCGTEYSRHSKKGIDMTKHRCGLCKSQIIYIGQFSADGTKKTERIASGFSLYVKEHFAIAKNNLSKSLKKGSHVPHSDIMQELSKMYHEEQAENSKNTKDNASMDDDFESDFEQRLSLHTA
jgi:predicted SprT family Zn-dependent metalloprotease